MQLSTCRHGLTLATCLVLARLGTSLVQALPVEVTYRCPVTLAIWSPHCSAIPDCVAGHCSWVYQNPASAGQPATADTLLYNHMGMLAPLANSSLLAAWQAAPVFWEGSRQQAIYSALSQDAGRTWSPPAELARAEGQLPLWAPVLHTEVALSPAMSLNAESGHLRLGCCRATAPGCSARPARRSAGGMGRCALVKPCAAAAVTTRP